MTDGRQLLEQHLNGEALSAEQRAALSAWVCASNQNAQLAAELMHLDQTVRNRLSDLSLDPGGSAAAMALAELAQIERLADTHLIKIGLCDEAQDEHAAPAEPLCARDVFTAAGYLGLRTLRSRSAIIGAVAAVLILGIAIINPFSAPDTQELAVQTPAGNGDHETDSALSTPTPVAHLSATDGAQWATPAGKTAPRAGDALLPGQTLTLTHGLAELTTARGAIALLQAPCTVEIIDHENGLLLHAGKLVGRVETDRAKGFVVRTPQRDVIDLGTEFGVDVTADGATGVFVFEGLVALAEPQADPKTDELLQIRAGQGQHIDQTGQATPVTDAGSIARFVRTMDRYEQYAHLILNDKPLIYYRLDGINEGVERNRAADRYHAQAAGELSPATEGGRTALSFNAFGASLQTTEPIQELRNASSYTIECWVRTARNDYGAICSLQVPDTQLSSRLISAARLETTDSTGIIGPSQHLRFLHVNTPADAQRDKSVAPGTSIYSDKPHKPGRWTHVAAVKDGERMTIYIDGQPANHGTDASPLHDLDFVAVIGRFSMQQNDSRPRTRQFLGQIDELAIYDHALTALQLRARVESGNLLDHGGNNGLNP